jgi:hypothetical protein
LGAKKSNLATLQSVKESQEALKSVKHMSATHYHPEILPTELIVNGGSVKSK